MTQGIRLVTQPAIQRSLLPLQQQQAVMQQAISGLQATLSHLVPLLDSGAGAALADILTRMDALSAALETKAVAVHTHQAAEIAGLAAALDGKAAAGHSHPASDITGLSTGGTFTGTIRFPVTQQPSLDPNTLDDYEEGVFNPLLLIGGLSAGIAHTVKVGRYIKIGRLVNIQLTIAITSKGTGTGPVTISGLPFPAISLAEAAVSIGQSSLGTITGYIPSNTSKIILLNASGNNITHINLSDSSSIKLSVSYETAS